MDFRRGNIHLAKLNPTKGAEAGKIRLVLIFQSDRLNKILPTVIVIPLTSELRDDLSPVRFRIKKRGKLEKDSDAMLDQIRAVDKKRLHPEIIATLTREELKIIEEYLNYVTGKYE